MPDDYNLFGKDKTPVDVYRREQIEYAFRRTVGDSQK